MGTVSDYFLLRRNPWALAASKKWKLGNADGEYDQDVIVEAQLLSEDNSYYYRILFDKKVNHEQIIAVINHEIFKKGIGSFLDGIEIKGGNDDTFPPEIDTRELVFSHRLILYIPRMIEYELMNKIVNYGKDIGLSILIRDNRYSMINNERETMDAFISHDSRDKLDVVHPLVSNLGKLGLNIWFDEYSLNPGDGLRESIERGLKESKKCIVVISDNYMMNLGWAKREFDSIAQREIIKKGKVIIPIWHNVTPESVYEFSPFLSDRVALNTNIGIDNLTHRLAKSIKD
jgi:hypothetical protein